MNTQPAPCDVAHPDGTVTCERAAQHRGDHTASSEDVSWPRTPRRSTARGTSNSDKRGSTADRRRRRARLVETWRADVALLMVRDHCAYPVDATWTLELTADNIGVRVEWCALLPATRCYCCGVLLHAGHTWPDGTQVEGTVTCDRIVPGAEGGTYAFANLRPACARHNSSTGGKLGVARKRAKTKAEVSG